jgi:hypothetical protein
MSGRSDDRSEQRYPSEDFDAFGRVEKLRVGGVQERHQTIFISIGIASA